MAPCIDLNADLGEECGDGSLDRAMLAVVTSASVAAGGHAGGGDILDRTVAAARHAGVVVGAHPSYPDREGFGRVSMADRLGPSGVTATVAAQVADVEAACRVAGTAMAHVKAHGALYADVAASRQLADAFLDAIALGAPGRDLAVLGPAGTALEAACAERGVRLVAEGFADRAYEPDGTLVPRSRPGSVHADEAVVAAQAVAIGTGQALPGSSVGLVVRADSICVHGDTPGAVSLARAVRAALEGAGVRVEPALG